MYTRDQFEDLRVQAAQEIIFRTRPRYIIELGVAWGGSLLFYSTLMHVLGGDRVIGVDIFIPDDLRKRIGTFAAVSDRITLINGSSTAHQTLDQIKSILCGSGQVMVLLDSNHTHDHVLSELRLYSPFIGEGHYLICGDTILEQIPKQSRRPRPWGPGKNPRTAPDEFLREKK